MISIYVDFHNTTRDGTVRLNTIGSIKDLNRQGIVLENGLAVRLYCEDFEVSGTVEYAEPEHMWTARFNWEDRKALNPDS